MPRIRTIKPEFWSDEKLAPMCPIDRLVFLGLISMADDAGRLVDNVKLIDGYLFCETDDTCRDSLTRLAAAGRIVRYVSESGQRLLQVAGWSKHQKVDHAAKYVLPGPRDGVASVSRDCREDVARSSRLDLRPTTYDQQIFVGQEPDRALVEKQEQPEPEAPSEAPPQEPDEDPPAPEDSAGASAREARAAAAQVIARLNELTGSCFEAGAKNNLKLVRARLNDGRTVDDMLAVVEAKVRQWRGNEEMAPYLRPSTLLRPGHFDDYLAEARKKAPASPRRERFDFDPPMPMAGGSARPVEPARPRDGPRASERRGGDLVGGLLARWSGNGSGGDA